jgi:urease accessory protein
MYARAVIVAEPGPAGTTRYPTLRSAPPLALRPTPEGLFVAASAGGPLGGDEVCVEVRVQAGAILRIRTVGATIALAGTPAAPSRWCWHFVVDVGGELAFVPEPTVVANGAWHLSEIDVTLAADARLFLREEVVLGRYGEIGGRWQGRLRITRAGEEVLVQEHDISGSSATDRGPYGVGDAAAFGNQIETRCAAAGSATGEGWARMPLAVADAVLGVAIAPDATTLRQRLEQAAQLPR